jgi:hypothetical protein
VVSLLVPPDLGAPVEAVLLDDKGAVVARSSVPDAAAMPRDPAPFEIGPVRDAVLAGDEVGHMEVPREGGDDLVVLDRLDSVGWTYVLVGDADELLSG